MAQLQGWQAGHLASVPLSLLLGAVGALSLMLAVKGDGAASVHARQDWQGLYTTGFHLRRFLKAEKNGGNPESLHISASLQGLPVGFLNLFHCGLSDL